MKNLGNGKAVGGMRFDVTSTIQWYSADAIPKYEDEYLLIITDFNNEEIRLGKYVTYESSDPKFSSISEFRIRGDENEDIYKWQPIDQDQILAWGYLTNHTAIRMRIRAEIKAMEQK